MWAWLLKGKRDGSLGIQLFWSIKDDGDWWFLVTKDSQRKLTWVSQQRVIRQLYLYWSLVICLPMTVPSIFNIRASIPCLAFRESWNVQINIELLDGFYNRGSRGTWYWWVITCKLWFQLCWPRNYIQQDTQKLIVFQLLTHTIQTHNGQVCKSECQFINSQRWIFLYRG